MTSKQYYPRLIDNRIKQELELFGAICIEGPKWCGKTWTSQHHSNSELFLGDPTGDFQNKKLAELSPELVLQGDNPRLIDEWQEVPSMWDAVRFEVDQRGQKGQFILTGSSTPIQKGVLHSGAGRISTLKMRPMSLFESNDSNGSVSLKDLFESKFSPHINQQTSLEKLINLVVRGGWPGSLNVNENSFTLITNQYIQAILNHDIYRLEGINRDSNKMEMLLKSLARNESTVVSISKLKKDILEFENEEIREETISTYLTIFERLFLIENIPSFSNNIRSSIKVKKSEKRHLIDPSLAVSLLGVNQQELLNDLNTFGFLFEGLCIRDLLIYADSIGANVSHYQDYKGKEIDVVLQLQNGQWGAFEIKLGENQVDIAAQNLLEIKEQFKSQNAKEPSILVVLTGLGSAAYQRKDGVYVVPITTLKP